MGLDGFVACDCWEKGVLSPPSTIASVLSVDAQTGLLRPNADDANTHRAFAKWMASRPCPHEYFKFRTRWLGNIAGIGRIRKLLSHESHDPEVEFPILWFRVVYSGTHGGDPIPFKEMGSLQNELHRLRSLGFSDGELTKLAHDCTGQERDSWEYVQWFFKSMEELVEASLSVGKPLCF